MLKKIPVYSLPFYEKEKLEFKTYGVQGNVIQRNDYIHKTELPHAHNYYKMYYFTDGSGMDEINFSFNAGYKDFSNSPYLLDSH